MIWIFAVISSVMLAIMLIRVLNIRKNDQVLYEFCDVRRKMMRYLRNNFDSVSTGDYLCLRESLDLLNNNIHYFDHYKTHVFNVNMLIRMIRETKKNIDEVERLKRTENAEILDLMGSFERSFLVAFFVFTPLFKTRACISLVVFVLTILVGIMKRISIDYANKIRKAVAAIEFIQQKKLRYAM